MSPSPRAAIATVLIAGTLAGCGARAPRVTVTDAWARSSPSMATMGAVYLKLSSATGDRLLGADVSDAVAGRTELHEVVTDSLGSMSMREIDAVELPRGASVEFKPGGRHIMLIDLRRPLVDGETIDVSLRFERAAPETARAKVREG